MEEKIILEGTISVKAAIEANIRKVYSIYMDETKKTKDFTYISRIAKKNNIPISITQRNKINELTNSESNGGICSIVGQRTYDNPYTLFEMENPFIVLLEGIEDPFNYGYCIRSAYAAGATGLIVNDRNWSVADKTVIKSSAGASEFIKTAAVNDFSPILEYARQHGITVISADRKNATSLYETTLNMPLILAIGGQMRGLSKSVYNNTDKRVYIPYSGCFRNSLNASSACSIMCFEISRQRMCSLK